MLVFRRSWFVALTALMVFASACAASTEIGSDATVDSIATNAPSSSTGQPVAADTPDDEAQDGDTVVDPSVALNLASLRVQTAPLFGRVDIDGLADSSDVADLRATATINGVAVDFPVFADDDGLYITAPLVVEAPGVAGEVEFQLTDGSATSPAMQLRIEPIAEAPGAAAAYLADLEASVEQAAALFGTSYDELASTEIDATAPELQLLKVQQLLVDDGTENDLSSWLLGDGERSAQEQALVDAVVGALVTAQEQATATPPDADAGSTTDATTGADGDGPEPTPEPTPANRLRGEKQDSKQPVHQTNAAAKLAQSDTCVSSSVVINSAGRLEEMLAKGQDALRGSRGAGAKVLSDTSAVLGAGSAIPGPVGVASGVLSTIPAGVLALDRLNAAELPSSLDSISFDADPIMFNEDFLEVGTLSTVQVTASSPGGGAVGDAISIGAGVTTLGANPVVSAGTTVATNLGADWLNNNVGGNCPTTWTVDITTSDFYDVAVQQGSVSYDAASGTYEPTEIGREIITVKAVIAGLTTSKSVEIITQEMGLTVTPEEIQVIDPGEIVSIGISFTNSDTERSTWTTEQGSFVDPVADWTGETPRLLQTPTDESAYPFWVTVQGNAITGLFADEARPHPSDAVLVRLSEIVISPPDAILLAGTTQQYTARNRDGQIVDVNWSASGGVIDESGLYVAGSEVGTFAVTATLKVNPDIEASVPVTITDPACTGQWALRVGPWMAQINNGVGGLGGGGAMIYTGGDYLLNIYEDGTWDGQRVGLTFLLTSSAGSLEITIDSNESGTVSFVPDPGRSNETVSVGFASVNETFSNAIVRLAGREQAVSAPSGFAGEASYSCSDELMEATSDGITATWDYLGPTE